MPTQHLPRIMDFGRKACNAAMMNLIPCGADCKHQREGYCCLEQPSAVTNSEGGCAYYVEKDTPSHLVPEADLPPHGIPPFSTWIISFFHERYGAPGGSAHPHEAWRRCRYDTGSWAAFAACWLLDEQWNIHSVKGQGRRSKSAALLFPFDQPSNSI